MVSRTAQPRNSRFFIFLLIGLCLFFFLTYTNRLIEYGAEQNRVEEWQKKIADAKLEQVELQAYHAYVQSPAYVEEISRRELLMSQAGDTLVVVLPAEEADLSVLAVNPIPIISDPTIDEPVWRQWLLLFAQ